MHPRSDPKSIPSHSHQKADVSPLNNQRGRLLCIHYCIHQSGPSFIEEIGRKKNSEGDGHPKPEPAGKSREIRGAIEESSDFLPRSYFV